MEYYPVYYYENSTQPNQRQASSKNVLSFSNDQPPITSVALAPSLLSSQPQQPQQHKLSGHNLSTRGYFYSGSTPNMANVISKSQSHHHMIERPPNTFNYKNLNFSNMSSITLNKQPNVAPLPPKNRNRVIYNNVQTQILLRRLGQNERIFHGQNDFSRSYIYRTVIITSEINLYENINTVYAALQEWKRVNPLLRCRVVNKQENTDQNASSTTAATTTAAATAPYGINKEKYFAFADETKINSMDNVLFLVYNSHHGHTCEDIWKLLVERETTVPLDGDNGLLWRLMFFHIKTVSKPGHHPSYLYAVTITFDHSIMDGRSSYSALLSLFATIEDMYKSNYKKQPEYMILPSKEDIYRLKRQAPHTPSGALSYLKAPLFLDIDNAIRTSYVRLKYLSEEEESLGIIYTHDKRPFITVKELVQISKSNNSKFRTLVIQKNDLNRILKRCKEHGVKLTAFLNMCLVFAIRMLYEKSHYQQHQHHYVSPTINYTTNISLREFPEYVMYDPSKNYVGCYIGLSFSTFNDHYSYYNNPNWIRDFWYYTIRESIDFHERLQRGEFIHSINLPAKKKERDEFFYHFGNSNLGVLQSSLDDRRAIRIRQAFATGRYSRENFLCWFSNLLATVDNQLCWTISFNTCFIKQEVINAVVDNLTKIIKELIK